MTRITNSKLLKAISAKRVKLDIARDALFLHAAGHSDRLGDVIARLGDHHVAVTTYRGIWSEVETMEDDARSRGI